MDRDRRQRLAVEVALAEPGFATARLDEALAEAGSPP